MVPDPPDTIDLGGGGSGPWPGFVLSGATSATGVNTTYAKSPNFTYLAANTAAVQDAGGGEWEIRGSNGTLYFEGTGAPGAGPWEAVWTPTNGAGGTLVFTRALAAPASINLGSGGATTNAQLTTALTGANNDLTFEALIDGRIGNSLRIRYVAPGTNNAALSASISDNGRDITVNLATNGSAQITSTAAQVQAAVNALDGNNQVVAGPAPSNDGTGVVTAMGWTNLTGGTGGTPLPPDTIPL